MKKVLFVALVITVLLESFWIVNHRSDTEILQENYLRLLDEVKHKDSLIDYYASTEGIKYVAAVKVPWETVHLLARVVHSEAGNCDIEAKRYVASVVMNRVGCEEFPDTVRDVVYQSGQFSVVEIVGAKGVPMIDEEPSIEDLMVSYEILQNGSVLPQRVLYFWDDSVPPIRGGAYKKVGNLIFAH